MDRTELAGLLCARLCHDLGSPVGAVVNGVDLIRELGAAQAGAEFDMLDRSARRAAALLRFHRIAFGAVRDPKSTVTRSELATRAKEVLVGPRIVLTCSVAGGPPLRAAAGRLAALMLLAGRTMLGLRGTLRLVLPPETDLPVEVIAEGERSAASPAQRRWLECGPGLGLDASELEFALIPAAASAVGTRIELIEGEGQLALRAPPV